MSEGHPGMRRAPGEGEGGGGGVPASRRAGSVQFQREGAREDEASMLDPANQSLADALRVMMGLLQLAMLVLAGLYVLSGIQKVNEGERGIRLLFGRKQAASLEPGASWSAPYPFGELIKVDQGYKEITIDRDFWQYVEPNGDASPEKLPMKASLKPGEGGSGSVLTADGNIAHTRWRVQYSRSNAGEYAQNVLSAEEEQKLVRAAVKRGIVQACARVGIEELLKQSGGQAGSVRQFAKQVAQETLDRVSSGIRLDTLDPLDTIPPTYVKSDFARVQSAASGASKAVENARAEANQRLLATAGQAGAYLIQQLDAYEVAAARRASAKQGGNAGELAEAEKEMRRLEGVIDGLLRGTAVQVAAGTVEIAGETKALAGGKVEGLTGGEVSNLLSSAAAYRASVVNKAKTDVKRFQAKLDQFNASPRVMVQRDWSEAVGRFLSREGVQYMLLPPGVGTLNLQLNPDPDIVREQQKQQKLREFEDAEQKRREEMDKAKYKTETGLQPVAG